LCFLSSVNEPTRKRQWLTGGALTGMGNFYTSSLLFAFRRLRTFVATPARPVPSSSMVVGSGTVLIVPLKSVWEFDVPSALLHKLIKFGIP